MQPIRTGIKVQIGLGDNQTATAVVLRPRKSDIAGFIRVRFDDGGVMQVHRNGLEAA